MVGYSKTRFIEMKSCINSILKIFPALEAYYANIPPKKIPRGLLEFLKHPLRKFLLVFVKDACENFENTILKIEGDKISGTEVIRIINDLLRRLKEYVAKEFISMPAEKE